MDTGLAIRFASRLPRELRDHAEGIDPQLCALIARARAGAPAIELEVDRFVEYVAERATFDREGRPMLEALHATDLWIAFGCVSGVSAALAAFETDYAPEIVGALGRSFDVGLAQDAELRFRERLFLVDGDEAPRLASFSGRGNLRAWLRAAAVRTAIDLMRARREVPIDPATLGDISAAADPLLASLKQRYRDEFRTAFAEAAAALTDRDRTLLRYRFLDELTIDEIGVLYRVHRATVARWIAAIRESLFETTRARLMHQLTISDSEADSVLRLIDSQLDISIEAMIR